MGGPLAVNSLGVLATFGTLEITLDVMNVYPFFEPLHRLLRQQAGDFVEGKVSSKVVMQMSTDGEPMWIKAVMPKALPQTLIRTALDQVLYRSRKPLHQAALYCGYQLTDRFDLGRNHPEWQALSGKPIRYFPEQQLSLAMQVAWSDPELALQLGCRVLERFRQDPSILMLSKIVPKFPLDWHCFAVLLACYGLPLSEEQRSNPVWQQAHHHLLKTAQTLALESEWCGFWEQFLIVDTLNGPQPLPAIHPPLHQWILDLPLLNAPRYQPLRERLKQPNLTKVYLSNRSSNASFPFIQRIKDFLLKVLAHVGQAFSHIEEQNKSKKSASSPTQKKKQKQKKKPPWRRGMPVWLKNTSYDYST